MEGLVGEGGGRGVGGCRREGENTGFAVGGELDPFVLFGVFLFLDCCRGEGSIGFELAGIVFVCFAFFWGGGRGMGLLLTREREGEERGDKFVQREEVLNCLIAAALCIEDEILVGREWCHGGGVGGCIRERRCVW